jgi:hypothetical protein
MTAASRSAARWSRRGSRTWNADRERLAEPPTCPAALMGSCSHSPPTVTLPRAECRRQGRVGCRV